MTDYNARFGKYREERRRKLQSCKIFLCFRNNHCSNVDMLPPSYYFYAHIFLLLSSNYIQKYELSLTAFYHKCFLYYYNLSKGIILDNFILSHQINASTFPLYSLVIKTFFLVAFIFL